MLLVCEALQLQSLSVLPAHQHLSMDISAHISCIPWMICSLHSQAHSRIQHSVSLGTMHAPRPRLLRTLCQRRTSIEDFTKGFTPPSVDRLGLP